MKYNIKKNLLVINSLKFYFTTTLLITVALTIGLIKTSEANEQGEEKINRTVSQAEGPFYPVENVPLDSDLLFSRENGGYQLLNLSGRVLDTNGNALENAEIVIWQTDKSGIYRHPNDPNRESLDSNFKGFSSTLTGVNGNYSFKTVIPGVYPGRPPHIHVKVFINQKEVLTTQLYIEGQEEEINPLMKLIFSHYGSKESLLIKPTTGQDGTLEANFDFVI